MSRLIYRGTAKVPAIPGPEGARVPNQDCAACGATNTPVEVLFEGDIVYGICVSSLMRACSRRYRQGRTPTEHQRFLKAEEAARRVPISDRGCGSASVPVG